MSLTWPMRRFVLACMLSLGLVSTASAGRLIISEVVDGSRTGGLPKFVELTNVSDSAIPDLSAYSIANANNGATTLGGGASTQLPAVPLAAGDSYVIAYEASPFTTFVDTYGFAPDFGAGGAFINGDDVILLFQGPAVDAGFPWTNIEDSFGDLGVDGTATAWEYMDSWARRNPSENQSKGGEFVVSAYTYGAVNSLDGVDDADAKAKLLALTNPGTHAFAGKGVPAAPAWALALIGTMLAGAGALAFHRMKGPRTA
jgi:hypothetical protein